MDEEIWQEHVYILEKAPGFGFGIAISGGKDNPNAQNGDPSIIISDVVRGGPAFDKLKINDIVTRVNGKPMFKMEHAKAVRELKNAGQRVELRIKRKVLVKVTPPIDRSRRMDRDVYSPRRDRSRSREYADSRRRQRSRSRELDSPRSRRRSYRRSLSRSSSRGRSYSRSPSRRSYSLRGSNSSYRRGHSRSPSRSSYRRGYSRSRTPSYTRGRSRSRTPSRRSRTPPSSRSPSPPRHSRFQPGRHRSIDDLHDAMSPLSPDPDSAHSDPDMMVFPVKKRDPKTVVLKKTKQNNSYGLKLGTRIFIQDIQPGSLADKSMDLTSGDTVLMINGRNVDNKTVQEAIQIIGLSKDKVTMLVKKEDGGTVSLPANRFRSPSRDKEETRHRNTRHPSRRSSTSKASSKSVDRSSVSASKPDKKLPSGIKVLPVLSPAHRRRSSSSSVRDTPEPAPRSKRHSPDREYAEPPGSEEEDGHILPPSARQITFVKGKNVGIRLAGGNDVGIFVASVLEGSPAAKQGLKMGDQILSVNDVNFRTIIREEAVLTLMGLPTGEEVKIIAQPQPDLYKKVLELGTGDSFYIRTHFKYEKNGEHELSFQRGSAFRISDTLYQGMVGYWLAVRIGRNNMEIERGVIPNSSRAEQMKMVQDKKIAQQRDRSNRGISRRIKNHKSDPSPASSTSAMFPAYERVVLREAGFKRPIVVFGPLADIARERLASDYYGVYEVARNEGVVRGQKSNRKGVIRLNTIKDIIEKDKHAILDITPTAVEKLNYAQLYPIVVCLQAASKASVKELRSKLATTDEEKKKKPGKLFDRAAKLQRGYSHVFTDTIRLDESDGWYRKLHSTIRDQQSMPVWVSKDKLGSGGEEAEEGVTIPGDDDQLSYVSAPASDYSVTTIGSDFNNSRVSDDDEEERRKPAAKAPSTSSDEQDGGKFGDDDFGELNDSNEEPPVDKVVAPPTTSKLTTDSFPRSAHHKQLPLRKPSSSSSSADVPITPNHAPKPPSANSNPRPEPTRGPQEIPSGRFDPQSFLKSHIRGLKPVGQDNPVSSRPNQPSQPAYRDEPVSYTQVQTSYQAPVEKREPQQPVYAQVNKNRPKQPTYNQPDSRGMSSREPDVGVNNFPQNDSYKEANARTANERLPVRQEPARYAPPNQPRSTYNRFSGSNQLKSDPKPAPSYNPPKNTYTRPPATNGMPQKSNFAPNRYNAPSESYNNARPYGNPSGSKLGPGSKEHMYDSGVDTYYNSKAKKDSVPVSPTLAEDEDPQVVATARGVFDSNGGVLSSVETGVSIVIPKGAIRPGVRQDIYFKVCRDNTALPPLDKNKGETLLSPLVMCGPHGLQFEHPVELRLPHCEPSQWANEANSQEEGNSVSVLIDHF